MNIPNPTALDSWTQFFKNIEQMGMLVLALVFSGLMAAELNRGTLVNLLTKGARRSSLVCAKFTVAALIWTLSYVLALAVTLAYTLYFWGSEPVPHAFLAFVSPWVFGLFLIALLMLGGVLSKNTVGSLLVCGGVVAVLNLVNLAPQVQRYNPVSLASGTLGLLSKQSVPRDFLPALAVCVVFIGAVLVAAVALFNRKQI